MIKAPYNFVPLPNKVVFPEWADKISIDRPFEDGISGTITVNYNAQTPVFIGNGKQNNNLIENYTAANGNCAIPGSSLRGMLRSVIEIASFGKFNRVTDEALSVRDLANNFYSKQFTGRTNTNSIIALSKAGWLDYEQERGWVLYPVNDFRIEDSLIEACYDFPANFLKGRNPDEQKARKDAKNRIGLFRNQLRVNFVAEELEDHSHHYIERIHQNLFLRYSKVTDIQKNPNGNGFIVLTGHPGSSKHMDFIFENKTSSNFKILEDKIILQFKQSNVSKAADQKKGLDLQKSLREYKDFKYPGIPVFYLSDKNGNPKSLGLSQMYRLPYEYGLKDAINNSNPSKDNFSDKMDFAECIFGKISNDSKYPEKSLRGRVQFEDAVTDEEKLLDEVYTILGSPKPTFYPNYIEQDSNQSKYKTLMDEGVKLRGWKRYPVKNETNEVKPLEDQKKVTSKFKPLPASTIFNGKTTIFKGEIHFHNLKKEELGALLWAITWGNDSNLSHSIGMGKPYGFGQIKAKIDLTASSYLENNSDKNEYSDFSLNLIEDYISTFKSYMNKNIDGWENSEQIRELKVMANPANANRENWDLSYMVLDHENNRNDFGNAKKRDVHNRIGPSFLASYSEQNQEKHLSFNDSHNNGNHSRNNNGNANGGYGYRGQYNNARETRNQGISTVRNTPNYPSPKKIIHTCELIEKKEKSGAWKVVSKDNPNMKGSISNYMDVPKDKKVGDTVTLSIKSNKDLNNVIFMYEPQNK